MLADIPDNAKLLAERGTDPEKQCVGCGACRVLGVGAHAVAGRHG